jgi:hypothetical protein
MKIIVTIAVALALSLGLVAFATPAEAAQHCVSRPEYGAVKEGWAKARVHRKFDTAGKRTFFKDYDGLLVERRIYQGCGSKRSTVTISYNMWVGKDDTLRVGPGGKTAVWFR